MKILRLIRSLNPEDGGPVAALRQITPYLADLGAHTTVVSLDDPSSPWLLDQPFNAFGLGPVLSGYGYRRGLSVFIRELAEQHDHVIVHGIWQYHSLATWRALRSSSIPYWVYPHGMLDPWFRYAYPRKHLKKWIYWPWADYRVLRDARGVLFTTEQERQLARQSFWLYHAHEFVVGYGTSGPSGDSSVMVRSFLAFYPHLRNQRIFLFLGRIHPKKGLDLLIDSFAVVAGQDPRLHLVVAGPDQLGLQTVLEQRVASLGLTERVTWTGMLSGDMKWGALHAAELFCLPSHQENFGMAVAEALSCACPVAIAEPVNISSDVLAAKAGLVHSDTLAGTTEMLQEWLSLSSSQQRSMGERARHLFGERFDVTTVASNLFHLLQA